MIGCLLLVAGYWLLVTGSPCCRGVPKSPRPQVSQSPGPQVPRTLRYSDTFFHLEKIAIQIDCIGVWVWVVVRTLLP